MIGSIHEKAGKWYVVVSFKDKTNKWKTKWISTGLDIKGNKRAAEKMMWEVLDDLSDKNVEMTDVLLADYFECWLDEQKAMVEPNTYRSYRGNMKNHIIPYFRGLNLKLKDLKTYHLDEYYNYKYSTDSMLNGKGRLSASTIQNHYDDYAAIFTLARYAGLRLEECFRIGTREAENAVVTGELFVKGKGGLVRYVPINESVRIELKKILKTVPRGQKLFVPYEDSTELFDKSIQENHQK